jgi:uncharacterized membrane protein
MQLIPGWLAFLMLAAIATAAAALALRFGPWLAAVGLTGAYLAPALVDLGQPSAFGLFSYLLAITAAALALAAGAASVDVAVTHALLAGDALQRIYQAGVGEFWSTDSVAHPSNVVALASLLAKALKSDSSQG